MSVSTRQAPISVIIPSYNCGQYLGSAIESCLSQSVRPHELIVVDDGSTDDTPSVLRSYEQNPLVRKQRQQNQGVATARNAGARIATGEYLLFLDADDELLPGDLEKKSDVASKYPDIDFWACDYMRSDVPGLMHQLYPSIGAERIFRSHGAAGNADIIRLNGAFSRAYARGENQSLIWTGAVTLRRRLFERVGGFRPQFKVTDDLDLWRRCLTNGESAMIRDHCGAIYYRWRGSKEKFEVMCHDNVERLKNEKKTLSVLSRSYWLVRKRIARQYLNAIWCIDIYSAGRGKLFRLLWSSIRSCPGLKDQIKYLVLVPMPKRMLIALYARRHGARALCPRA